MSLFILNSPTSGVTLDDQTARGDELLASDTQIVTHDVIGVTDKWLEFREDLFGSPCAAINSAYTSIALGSAVLVVSGYVWVSGTPTNTRGLVVLSEDGGAHSYGYVRIGYGADNTRIAVTDWQGNLIAESITEVALSGATGIAVAFDWVNYATVHVRIYIDSGSGWVQEAHVDSGLSRSGFFNSSSAIFWGELAGVGRGAYWRGVHLAAAYSTTAGDAPHLTPWPVLLSGGCVAPKAQGTYDEWNGGASTHVIGSGLRWQDVGLTNDMKSPGVHPGNDGDTSLVASGNVNEQKQTFVNAVDNHPIQSVTSPVVDEVRLMAVIRASGGGKFTCNPLLRLSGANTYSNSWLQGGTAYTGRQSADAVPRPGGGSWAVADFAPAAGLEWGGQTPTAVETGGVSIGARITSMPGPIPTYHVETLPTGEPGAVGLEVPRQVAGAKAPVIRPQFDHLAELRATGGVLRQMRETEETLRRIIRARRRDSGRCGRSGSVLVRR